MAVKRIFLDLETIPPCELEDFEMDKTPPKNIKDPAKIEKWYEENHEAAFRKMALDPNQAQILCLGAAVEDDDVEVFYDENESVENILREFNDFIVENTVEYLEDDKELHYEVKWVGHNVRKFDLEVIWVWCMKLQLFDLAKLISRHPYSNNVIDTMEIWSGPNRQGYVSLDTILKTLGIGGKMEGMDGSKVYDEYKAGNLHTKIIPYQIQDVEDVRKIYRAIEQGLS